MILTVAGPMAIKTEQAFPTAWVYVDTDAEDLGAYVAEAKDMVAEMVTLPQGYTLTWSGQYEYMERAKDKLAVVVPATLVIIFLLLYLNFGRMGETLIVLLSLPFALVGGVVFLALHRGPAADLLGSRGGRLGDAADRRAHGRRDGVGDRVDSVGHSGALLSLAGGAAPGRGERRARRCGCRAVCGGCRLIPTGRSVAPSPQPAASATILGAILVVVVPTLGFGGSPSSDLAEGWTAAWFHRGALPFRRLDRLVSDEAAPEGASHGRRQP